MGWFFASGWGSEAANAIHLPSGDQLIGVPEKHPGQSTPGEACVDRNFFSGPPSAGTTYKPVSLPEIRWKAIRVPSGDQAEPIHVSEGCRVRRNKFSLPMTFT